MERTYFENKNHMSIRAYVIYNGVKIMHMSIKKNNVTFLDRADFPKTFGLKELKKKEDS